MGSRWQAHTFTHPSFRWVSAAGQAMITFCPFCYFVNSTTNNSSVTVDKNYSCDTCDTWSKVSDAGDVILIMAQTRYIYDWRENNNNYVLENLCSQFFLFCPISPWSAIDNAVWHRVRKSVGQFFIFNLLTEEKIKRALNSVIPSATSLAWLIEQWYAHALGEVPNVKTR